MGYLVISEQLLEHPEFQEDKYSRREALIYLIQNSSPVSGTPDSSIEVSQNWMAKKFDWTRYEVQNFLKTIQYLKPLRQKHNIEVTLESTSTKTVITFKNTANFEWVSTAIQHPNQPRVIQVRGKKGKSGDPDSLFNNIYNNITDASTNVSASHLTTPDPSLDTPNLTNQNTDPKLDTDRNQKPKLQRYPEFDDDSLFFTTPQKWEQLVRITSLEEAYYWCKQASDWARKKNKAEWFKRDHVETVLEWRKKNISSGKVFIKHPDPSIGQTYAPAWMAKGAK